MTIKLTFYGGVNEIGGNKIIVEDRDTKLFFDFGLSFNRYQQFYSGFLTPRKVAGAKDELELGNIPWIEGLYSEEALRDTELKYQPSKFAAIFISHPHSDHFFYLKYADKRIPVYLGECTLNVIETFDPYNPYAFGKHEYRTFRTGRKISVGNICVEPIHVDHSVPGSYGFLIHTTDGTIVYTGDYRAHGPAAEMTREFVEKAKQCDPVALIIEGTRLGRQDNGQNLSEEDVRRFADKIVANSEKLTIATFYGRDIDRIRTFDKAARDNDRKFVVSMRTALLLDKLKDDPKLHVPDPLRDDNILIYAKRKISGKYSERDYFPWERPYLEKSVGYRYIQENFDRCLLNLDLYNFAELNDIRPRGGEFIHSMSEPYNEGGMDQINFGVMLNWLNHYHLTLHQAHSSGHATEEELQKTIEQINPKKVIPVHTDKPEMMCGITKGIEVILSEYGKEIEIK